MHVSFCKRSEVFFTVRIFKDGHFVQKILLLLKLLGSSTDQTMQKFHIGTLSSRRVLRRTLFYQKICFDIEKVYCFLDDASYWISTLDQKPGILWVNTQFTGYLLHTNPKKTLKLFYGLLLWHHMSRCIESGWTSIDVPKRK